MADGRLGYRFGGDVRPMGMKPISIRVRQADGTLATRSFTTLHTMHGPVIRSEGGRLVSFAIMDNPVKAL